MTENFTKERFLELEAELRDARVRMEDRGERLEVAEVQRDKLRDAVKVLLAAKHIREDNPHFDEADLADLQANAEKIAHAALVPSP